MSGALQDQVLAVEPSVDGALAYRPCQVTLVDGSERDFVYLCEAGPWFDFWGIDPEDDGEKTHIDVEDVRAIAESPSRLPARFANVMYRAGESRMGGCDFVLLLRDGRRLSCGTGNAVDFLRWPEDVSPTDIVELIPHAGDLGSDQVQPAPSARCLYETDENKRAP